MEFCLLRFTNLVVTGTWTDYEFPETLGNVIIPTDFQSIIFQRGRHTNHQPDMATRDPTIRRKSSLAAAWFGRIATPDFKVFIMIFLFKLDGCWWHSHLDTFLFIPIVYNPMVIQLYMFILVYTIHVCWLDTNCLIHAVKKITVFFAGGGNAMPFYGYSWTDEGKTMCLGGLGVGKMVMAVSRKSLMAMAQFYTWTFRVLVTCITCIYICNAIWCDMYTHTVYQRFFLMYGYWSGSKMGHICEPTQGSSWLGPSAKHFLGPTTVGQKLGATNKK